MFVHEDPEWAALLSIIADATGRQVSFVEKDYWVTHALWALHIQGFDVWFKGGTSLSKGFGLIERFSEDLDLRVDAGSVGGLTTPVLPWDDSNKKRRERGIVERRAWFDAIATHIQVPGCSVRHNPLGSDQKVRSAWLEVLYPLLHEATLPPGTRPFVLLELGRARVVPFVERAISSWVHDHLEQTGQLQNYVDNRPRAVRCVHPMVTCLEKLDAIARRFDQGKSGADFVRHYEDAAQIIAQEDTLGPPDAPVLADLLRTEDGKSIPRPEHPAFNPDNSERWVELQAAWLAIGPMYWGPRINLGQAAGTLRAFLCGFSRPAS